MSNDCIRDFSIRKEIEVEVKENLGNLDVDIDEIYNDVECDELMLSIITLTICSSIEKKLSEKGISTEKIISRQEQLKLFIVQAMMDRGII